jgi:DNA repair protein RecN (Recombination protein N)
MLLSLAIRDFVIVDALALDFAPGFTVLTGETGAGKSILIDALQLALGERAEADVVREGAARAEVCAEFRAGAAVAAWLAGNELQGDGDAVLVRRVVDAGGRSRAFINGSAVTLAQLRAIGELLLDVHGQHAHQSLLRPAAQLALLDAHGALADSARAVAKAHAAWRQAVRALEEAQAMEGSTRAEGERLRWIVEELAPVAPQPGEWAQVEAEHRRLSHGAGLIEGSQAAVEMLADAEASALSRVDAAAERLARLAEYDARLQPLLETLAGARAQIDDAARELNRYLSRADLDQARLAEVEARVTELHAAARRFRCTPEELAPLLQASREKLAALAAASDLDGLRRREAAARADYDRAASLLSRERARAARAMAREVTRAMQDLSMAGGRFEVALAAGEPAASGAERAEFLVAGHAGVTPRPLARVASGGELARISLAIAVIAAGATPVATLIFDEVDAGIGGAVAETVGRLLKQLGGDRQVLCVTHLPQVAARADQHLVVSKLAGDDGRPLCRVASLDRKARIDELARMLGGHQITDTTRKHAREMLAS